MFTSLMQDKIKDFIVRNITLKKIDSNNNQKKSNKRIKNDAFGTLCFQGFGQTTSSNSPYIKVSAVDNSGGTANLNDDDKQLIDNVWKLMSEYWCVKKPKLIISVTGGAKSFYMRVRLREIFKRGLMKAAASSDAWIVTGGTKAGVMEIVGEAVRDYHLQNGSAKQIVVVGIAVWGIVANRDRLMDKNNCGCFPCYYNIHEINPNEQSSALLDPNHTHFFLVDNGLTGEEAFGGEIGFRTALENFVSKKAASGTNRSMDSIPAVLLVLDGGRHTLHTTCQAIEQSTPVVIIEGSGRAADFIAFASKLKTLEEPNEEILLNQADKLLSPTATKRYEHNICCVDYVRRILHKDRKHLITIIKQEKEESEENIDQAIINALIKASEYNTANQLELALTWNRHDIARNEIFSVKRMDQWRHFDLTEVMHRALIEDKDEFVTLFLDCGLDLRKFLTIERLYRLYRDTLKDPTPPPIVCLVRNLTRDIRYRYWLCGKSQNDDNEYPPDLLQIIGRIINKLTEDQRVNVYSDKKYIVDIGREEYYTGIISYVTNGEINYRGRLSSENQRKKFDSSNNTAALSQDSKEKMLHGDRHIKEDFEYTERELFIWALLFNRKKLAEIFWKNGKDHISGALSASMLLTSLSQAANEEEELDLAQNLNDNALEFQKLAVGVLNECYQKDKPMSHELLVRELKQWGNQTLFLMADAGKQMDFMEHTCCQTKLNKNWKGKMALNTSIWLIILGLFFPFVSLPLIKFTDDYDTTSRNEVAPSDHEILRDYNPNRNSPSKRKAKRINLLWAIYYYQTAPVVKFCYHTISFLIFLALFSFFMVTNFKPYDSTLYADPPSIAEYITYFWVFTMWIEEIRQIVSTETVSKSKKLQAYFSSSWNRFDQVIFLFFIISVILRWTLSADQFIWARMLYTITLSFFYLRFLQVFYVEKNIGPKVVMIRQMFDDLLTFIGVLAVFILSYGVAAQVLLYPNTGYSWEIFKKVVMIPYFQMYGEMFLDQMQGDVPGCSSNATVYENNPDVPRCPENSWLVMVLFSIYLILTNILLINLLIAMFSFTFNDVQDNSAKVWRFYRYGLIKDYFFKPTLAPPLSIFGHIYRFGRFLIRYCRNIPEPINDFKQRFSEEKDCQLTEFERSGMIGYYVSKKRVEQEGQGYKLNMTGKKVEELQLNVEFLRTAASKPVDAPGEDSAAKHQTDNNVVPIRDTLDSSTATLKKLEDKVDGVDSRLSGLEDQISEIARILREQPRGHTATRVTRNSANIIGTHRIQIRDSDGDISDV